MDKYIIALDEGTSSCRAVLFDKNAQIIDIAQQEFSQIFPKPGWVEHDPIEIWEKQLAVFKHVIKNNNLEAKQIVAIGITNQRETVVVWDKQTGKPIYNAIVWQDKRTSDICEQLKADQWEPIIKAKTGLIVDAYFSGTKIQWILDNVAGARTAAEKGELLFGTIETWLIWNLTQGKVHASDVSNASRTMLFNIESQEWDDELLEALNVPQVILPEVLDCDANFGIFEFEGARIPIAGVVGDQQAALFGQYAWQKGMVKNTYGTGCFMLLNTGQELIHSQTGLLTTVAWRRSGEVSYALEGSVFIAGAAIQWLRDALQLIDSAKETFDLAQQADPDDKIVVVPAFAGLGAPYWDMNARGAAFGLSRGSGKAELVRATLNSLALQTYDVLMAMRQDSGAELKTLRVDGGAIANDYLTQYQADILKLNVERPKSLESTATGAALMAGLGIDFWTENFLLEQQQSIKIFTPEMDAESREQELSLWHKAIERSRGWLDEN